MGVTESVEADDLTPTLIIATEPPEAIFSDSLP